MIKLHRTIVNDIDQILHQLLILKSTNTYRYLSREITMNEIDDQIRAQQINFSGSFQQTQIQTGANSTMNINQINNQALQLVCNQIREVINNSQEPDPIKQTLNTDINNFENAQGNAERKSAFESLLSNSASIATLWSSLAPYIPELMKYIG